jgi:asparagine synthase (glutamine-hydrolysing)
VEKALLREAFAGWLPHDQLWRGKEQFGDGSGAGEVLAALAARRTPTVKSDRVGDVPEHGWALRSDEEVLYYTIWRERFHGLRPDANLGAFATA